MQSPEEVLALRPSSSLQAQIDRLAEQHKAGVLSAQDALLWKQYEYFPNGEGQSLSEASGTG